MSILSSFADEIWYKDVLPWTMCCLSSQPSCDLAILYMLVFMVRNATFNNISVISWRSVLLVKETRVFGEYSWPVASHQQTLSLTPKDTQLFSSIFESLLYIKFLQTTDFKSKIQFYMTKTSIMSEASNLLEHIRSFIGYDIHSQSECSVLCHTGILFYICCHGFLYACTNFHYWWSTQVIK